MSDTAEEEEEENDDGEALRERTPTLPDGVFDSLPDLLHAGLKYVSDKRERDILLLAMITVISSLLHTVTAYYARKRYWTNLYCFVVAAAASNKGVLEYALSLCKYYFKEIADNNDQLESTYKKGSSGKCVVDSFFVGTECFPHGEVSIRMIFSGLNQQTYSG